MRVTTASSFLVVKATAGAGLFRDNEEFFKRKRQFVNWHSVIIDALKREG